MATHWSSCEVPKGARMISGASTMLTLAEKGRQKIFEFRWAIRLSLAEKGRRLDFESGRAMRLINYY